MAAPGGGVEAETDVPTAPQTDALNSTGDAGNSLPILLIVLGIVGLAAVVLTPARARRRSDANVSARPTYLAQRDEARFPSRGPGLFLFR